MNELNIIRQSLYELEVQHSKIRGQYEDELSRLRNELLVVRQSVPSSAPQPPPLGPGGIGPPGTSSGPPVAPGLPPSAGSFNDPYYGRDRERDRERERGEPRDNRDRERLIDREREREMRDRDRERDKDRDRDRSIDHRDAKRLKMDNRDRERSILERGGGGSERDNRDRGERDRLDRDSRMKVDRPGKHSSYTLPRSPPPHHHGYHHSSSSRPPSPYLPPLDHNSPSLGPGISTKLPPPVSTSTPGPLGPGFPPAPSANGPYQQQPSNALPPVNDPGSAGTLVPLNGFPDDPDTVPDHLKKHGSDWFALWNPKAKRVLDVSLVHTLTHERFVSPSQHTLFVYLFDCDHLLSVVCCVRFSADGKYLATGCNRSAQIYDTKTGAITTYVYTSQELYTRTNNRSSQHSNRQGSLEERGPLYSERML